MTNFWGKSSTDFAYNFEANFDEISWFSRTSSFLEKYAVRSDRHFLVGLSEPSMGAHQTLRPSTFRRFGRSFWHNVVFLWKIIILHGSREIHAFTKPKSVPKGVVWAIHSESRSSSSAHVFEKYAKFCLGSFSFRRKFRVFPEHVYKSCGLLASFGWNHRRFKHV